VFVAGPYGHRLLGIDIERSHRFEQEIIAGCEGIKPGWVRVSFNYFISPAVFQYIVDAVHLVATHGWTLLRSTASTLIRPVEAPDGLVEPPLRLSELHYDADGELRWPSRHERAPESALSGYIRLPESWLKRCRRASSRTGSFRPIRGIAMVRPACGIAVGVTHRACRPPHGVGKHMDPEIDALDAYSRSSPPWRQPCCRAWPA